MSDHLDLKTATVDDLVDTATARLSEAEDALRELAKRDPEGDTRLGYEADISTRWMRREIESLKRSRRIDIFNAKRATATGRGK